MAEHKQGCEALGGCGGGIEPYDRGAVGEVTRLAAWLQQHSSGIYRPAADAADLLVKQAGWIAEMLAREESMRTQVALLTSAVEARGREIAKLKAQSSPRAAHASKACEAVNAETTSEAAREHMLEVAKALRAGTRNMPTLRWAAKLIEDVYLYDTADASSVTAVDGPST